LFTVTDVHLYTELLVNMFCHMLGTVNGTVTTARASEGDLQMGEAAFLETCDMEIDKAIDAFEEGEDFSIRFEEVDDGLVKSCEGFIFFVTPRIVSAATVEHIPTTVAAFVSRDSFFEREGIDIDYKRRPPLSFGHLPLYGETIRRVSR
jgi:hypothetical protein